VHAKLGSVYAYVPELDAWRVTRAKSPRSDELSTAPLAQPRDRVRLVAIPAILAAILLSGLWWTRRAGGSLSRSNEFPKPLTTWLGTQNCPSFSPDGNNLAFTWDGDRRDNFDIYTIAASGGVPVRLTTDPAADYSPAWSPDGKSIAFLRCPTAGTSQLMSIPASGGPERLLAKLSTRTSVQSRDVSWSPGGRWLAVTDLLEPGSPSRAIFIVPANGGPPRLLAGPSPGASFAQPNLSPDGRVLAFVCTSPQGGGGLCQLPLTPDGAAAGAAHPIAIHGFQNGSASVSPILSPVWTPDGRSLIFASMKFGVNRLWRVSRDGGEPALIAAAGERVTLPATSPKARRLAFTRRLYNTSVWRLDLQSPEAGPSRSISSTHPDLGAQYSPDGSKLAFASERTGIAEIWISNRDGSNQVQLTHLKEVLTGDPAWSPDGSRLAFDSLFQGHSQIYFEDIHGGEPVRALTETSIAILPSWSPDGQWIYFCSDRGGDFQIWRTPVKGGQPVQVTSAGGFASAISPDGRWLYYTAPSPPLGDRPVADLDRHGIARTIRSDTSVWRMPVQGGPPVQIADKVLDRCFAPARDGVYAIRRENQEQELVFYPLDRGAKPRAIATLRQPLLPGLSISPDETSALFTFIDQNNVNLMLLENFR